jgi:death-on-curing protein
MLDSALAQPRATFGGRYLHPTVFAQAGAYAFHISENQPFHDANKRTGLAAAHVFLRLNGWALEPSRELDRMIVKVARGRATKDDLAQLVESLCTRHTRTRRQLKI